MLWGQRCTTKADIFSFGVVLWVSSIHNTFLLGRQLPVHAALLRPFLRGCALRLIRRAVLALRRRLRQGSSPFGGRCGT